MLLLKARHQLMMLLQQRPLPKVERPKLRLHLLHRSKFLGFY